jgi:hypothetical protein
MHGHITGALLSTKCATLQHIDIIVYLFFNQNNPAKYQKRDMTTWQH